MYHAIVKRIIVNGFENVSRGNYEAVLSQCAPNVTHFFAGDHALGGQRRDVEALRRWFQRLGRLLPVKLTITNILVRGMPWNTTAIVQWTAQTTLSNGMPYHNAGVHFLTLRWGKAYRFQVYEDSQAVARALSCLAEHGVEEAIAPPIVS
jgi:ketosteroid isomerase-like protein